VTELLTIDRWRARGNMGTMLETILTALITAAGANGIFVFILQKWFEHKCATELETHRANLKRDYDVQIEKLRSELQVASAERSFRFSHVFEHTAKVIVTTYQKLLELQTAVNNFTQLLEPSDDLHWACHEKTDTEVV